MLLAVSIKKKMNVCVQSICLISLFLLLFILDLQDQLQRAMMLEQERRRAEEAAAQLEAERQAALLAKEELARQAEDQKKSQDQLVSILRHCAIVRGLSTRLPTFPNLPAAVTY